MMEAWQYYQKMQVTHRDQMAKRQQMIEVPPHGVPDLPLLPPASAHLQEQKQHLERAREQQRVIAAVNAEAEVERRQLKEDGVLDKTLATSDPDASELLETEVCGASTSPPANPPRDHRVAAADCRGGGGRGEAARLRALHPAEGALRPAACGGHRGVVDHGLRRAVRRCPPFLPRRSARLA